jgi:amidohydrolase
MQNIKELANSYADYICEIRHDLHAHPEESMKEFRTTDVIAGELDKMGIPYRRFEPTGLIATITGGKPGKTIGLRGDIDALSITEKTDVPFKSQNPGFMHACGHDTHASMLLGAAKILNGMKDELNGTVKLIFQPAEEIAEGAKTVIKQGALDGVDAMFGIHISAQKDVGSVYLRAGSSQAAADIFKIKVIGKAGHGATPDACVDATVCASAIVMNLQSLVSRETTPLMPLVVTVGTLNSGTRFNIVSGEATLTGTCRSFDVKLHHSLPDMMERIVKATCEAYRCTYEFEYKMMTEVVVNTPEIEQIAWDAAKKVVDNPDTQVVEAGIQMGAEDFSEYTVLCPSCFGFVGAGGDYPHHSDYFYLEESAFPTGAALYAQVAVDYLEKNK